ncbi:MAG: hypothetical protein HYT85_02975 [candidate division NC10 bacterium]|nr:hypothetical protein [candidate division NC10 bacterium]
MNTLVIPFLELRKLSKDEQEFSCWARLRAGKTIVVSSEAAKKISNEHPGFDASLPITARIVDNQDAVVFEQ